MPPDDEVVIAITFDAVDYAPRYYMYIVQPFDSFNKTETVKETVFHNNDYMVRVTGTCVIGQLLSIFK